MDESMNEPIYVDPSIAIPPTDPLPPTPPDGGELQWLFTDDEIAAGSTTPPPGAVPFCSCKHAEPQSLTCPHTPGVTCGGPSKCGFCRYRGSVIAAKVEQIKATLLADHALAESIHAFLGLMNPA